MGILDEIAKGSTRTVNPITAFLVGRQQKDNRDLAFRDEARADRSANRADRNLELQGTRVGLEQRRLDEQIRQDKVEQARLDAESKALQARADRIIGTIEKLPISPEEKTILSEQSLTDPDGALEGLRDALNPDLEFRKFRDGDDEVAGFFDGDGNMVREAGRSPIKTGASSGKVTAGQSKAAGFAQRIVDANGVFDNLDAQKTETLDDGSTINVGLEEFTDFQDRFVGLWPQGFRTEGRQAIEQAQRNFINAILRRESGAAINPSEFASAAIQYFPQPGDDRAQLAQKKQNRIAVQASLEVEAGPALQAVSERVRELEGNNSSDSRVQREGGLPNQVKIQGKDVDIGGIIYNDAGQAFRVNPDGKTVTLIEAEGQE